jgi:single-strand DNA-binding protein
MLNKVQLIGRVGKDPEIKHLESGSSVANFTLATSEKYTNKKGEKVENTEWHSIVAWNKLAEIIEKYIEKGDLIYIEGKLTYRKYEGKDGETKYITEIKADGLEMLSGKSKQNKPEPSLPDNEPSDDLPY